MYRLAGVAVKAAVGRPGTRRRVQVVSGHPITAMAGWGSAHFLSKSYPSLNTLFIR
jgi:hypothetical protein